MFVIPAKAGIQVLFLAGDELSASPFAGRAVPGFKRAAARFQQARRYARLRALGRIISTRVGC